MELAHPLETLMLDGIVLVCARLACCENLTLENTQEGLNSYSHYIISQEVSKSGKLHQHIIASKIAISEKSLTEDLKKIYPDAKGNKCIYVKKANNYKQAIKYTLKEGEYVSRGISTDYLDTAKQLSKSKENMQKEFTRLEEQVLLRQIPFPEFLKNYVELKLKYNQTFYLNHMRAYFIRVGLQCNYLDKDDFRELMLKSLLPQI